MNRLLGDGFFNDLFLGYRLFDRGFFDFHNRLLDGLGYRFHGFFRWGGRLGFSGLGCFFHNGNCFDKLRITVILSLCKANEGPSCSVTQIFRH